jgi:hypothetical protein
MKQMTLAQPIKTRGSQFRLGVEQPVGDID